MSNTTPAPQPKPRTSEQDAKILKTIRDARDRGTREGQIKEARKEGYVMVGISGAGVIGH